MTRDFYFSLILLIFCVFAIVYLYKQIRTDWKDHSKRGHNIVFIIAIIGGGLGAFVGAYRVALELIR